MYLSMCLPCKCICFCTEIPTNLSQMYSMMWQLWSTAASGIFCKTLKKMFNRELWLNAILLYITLLRLLSMSTTLIKNITITWTALEIFIVAVSSSCLGRQLMMRFYPDFKNLQIYQGVHGYQSIQQNKAKCYMPHVTRYSEDNNVTQTARLVVMILHQERAIKKPKTYHRKMQRFSQFSQGLSVLTSRLTSSKDSNLRSVSRDNICWLSLYTLDIEQAITTILRVIKRFKQVLPTSNNFFVSCNLEWDCKTTTTNSLPTHLAQNIMSPCVMPSSFCVIYVC